GDGQALDLVDVGDLVSRYVPHQVQATGEQLRDLSRLFRNLSFKDFAYLGLPFGTSLPILRILDEGDRLTELEAFHLVRAGADRLLAHSGRPDLGIVDVGIDRHRSGDVFERCRKWRFEVNPNAVLIDFLGILDPKNVAHRQNLV